MSHTPGPWGTTEKSWEDMIEVHPEDNGLFTIAKVRGFAMDEARANACLIAAAPELLAACVTVLDEERYVNHIHPDVVAEIRAAIAKATGATP